MTILIADDEYLARVAIKGLIEDVGSGSIDEILEVGDGASLVKLVRHTRPDIAFVDIRMPEMDGLEAIRRAKSSSPLTEWVILTGFSEFEFAKQAIELHVSTYMLKPVIGQDFQRAFAEIRSRHQESLLAWTRQIERDVLSLLNGEEAIYDTLEGTSHLLLVSTVSMEVSAAELAARLRKMLIPHITAQCLFSCVCITDTEIILLSRWFEESGKRQWERAYQELIACISSDPVHDQIRAARSDDVCGIPEISQRIMVLKHIKDIRICLAPHAVTDYDEVRELVGNDSIAQWCKTLDMAHKAYRSHDLLQYRDMIGRLEMVTSDFLAALPEHCMPIVMRNIGNLFSWECVRSEGIRGLVTELHMLGEEDLRRRQSPDRHVDSVLRYLQEHFHEDIGIDTISRMLGVTPNYLSMIISRTTGERFSDHIARIRVDQAELLLSTTDLTIQEIARRVGYRSVRHFTQLFQRRTGTNPSTCRKRRRGV